MKKQCFRTQPEGGCAATIFEEIAATQTGVAFLLERHMTRQEVTVAILGCAEKLWAVYLRLQSSRGTRELIG